MKKIIARTAVGLALIGSVSVAPVIPAGNGLISEVKFRNPVTNEISFSQIPDDQFDLMAHTVGGNKYNPTATSSDGVALVYEMGVQYNVNDSAPYLVPADIASSSAYITEKEARKRFKDDEKESLLNRLTPKAQAAITFADHNGSTAGSGTTMTTTLNCTCDVVFGALWLVGSGAATMTYNGSSMTQIETVTSKPGAPENEYLFGMVAPTNGSSLNLTASYPSSSSASLQGVTFLGVKQTGLPDAHSSQALSGATTVTQSVTTIGDNAWGVLFTRNDAGAHGTAGTNSTIAEDTGTGTFFYSTTPKTPAGTLSMQVNFASASNVGALMASFLPAPPTVAVPDEPVLINIDD